MKRRLTVTIDADEKTCGKCERLERDYFAHYCGVFSYRLGDRFGAEMVADPLRCQPCLDAEVREDLANLETANRGAKDE